MLEFQTRLKSISQATEREFKNSSLLANSRGAWEWSSIVYRLSIEIILDDLKIRYWKKYENYDL